MSLPDRPPTTIRRRFLQVGGRRVHYLRAGDGPPAVLVHSSPANARLLVKEIAHLARDHTVFAFDTPGFGLSDPLPGATLSVADLADALAETLAAIGMPRCPLFGTHTGAAIGLEFGVRHPDRVTGLMLDGVPAFTGDECERFFGGYFQPIPPTPLGGQYAETWTRFRDQSIWFPWTNRTPEHLNRYDLSPPHSTHLWASMYFEAAEHYTPAYRAASFYGARAIAAAAELTVPAAFCATETDMLHPHLDRLPPMRDGQAIVPIGSSYERKRQLIAERFALYGADGPAPADRDAIRSSTGVARQFVDGDAGQLHLRHAGDRGAPPLLLLHDAPGSGEQAEALVAELAMRFFVVAPDLPGNGESDAFASAPDADTLAGSALAVLDRLGIERAVVYGIGFGASIALALADRHPDRAAALVVQGLALPDAEERADMQARYAPPVAIEPDGAHWYRTWLMLRDMQVYWPWYNRTLAGQRRVDADFGARPLHRRTMDVMRAHASYGQLIHAALDHDAAAALGALAVPLVQVRDPQVPLSAHDARLAGHRMPAAVIDRRAGRLAERLIMTFPHG
jgi:pimeloyl-ACP methyl ester carboxylesterase